MADSRKNLLLFVLLFVLLAGVFFASSYIDRPVQFTDPNLELAIREQLNHYDKPIFRSQLLSFTALDLSSKRIQDLDGIEHCRNLEVLVLHDNDLVDVSPLASLSKLRALDLSDNHIVDLAASNFDKLSKLQLVDLNLDHNVVLNQDKTETRISDIQILQAFTELVHLSLAENQIIDINAISELHNLNELDLRDNWLTKIDSLKNLSNLEYLNLRGNHINDISSLVDLTELRYLNLHSNQEIQDLTPLGNLSKLETLILRNVPVGEQINVLENLPKLERLNIRNCGVSDFSVLVSLMEKGALQDNPTLGIEASLNILENEIPNDPHQLRGFRPYWDNISEKFPLTINDSILTAPTFSHESGFYKEEIILTLEAHQINANIHFTLDGSNPTNESPIYSEPIILESQPKNSQNLQEGIIVRARIIDNKGFDTSPIITKTFFVGTYSTTWSSLPVISLVIDPDHFFGSDIGIYADGNYRERGKRWERPAQLEFFESDGEKTFSESALIRIHGSGSRPTAQKALRIYAENNYGGFEPLDFEFFPGLKGEGTGEDIVEFKTILLRNTTNRSELTTLLRDVLVQELVSHTSLDIQAYRPTVVFLNGEYWGVYYLRERSDEYYLESHYQLNPEEVTIHKIIPQVDFYNQPREGNEFLQLLDYIGSHDIKDNEVYNYVSTQIDIENFIENQITYIYAGNGDWFTNNVKFWRKNILINDLDAPPGHDGRWRWMVVDLDFAFFDIEDNILAHAIHSSEISFLMSELIKNPHFKLTFINRYADHLNTSFSSQRVIEVIHQLAAEIEPEMPDHIRRWNKMGNSVDQWYDNVNFLREFALKRPEIARQQIIDEFELDGSVIINFKSDSKQGYIKVNSIDITENTPGIKNPSDWAGIYFLDIPIIITAIPNPGSHFSHWEGVPEENVYNQSITLTPTEDLEIRAIFKSESN